MAVLPIMFAGCSKDDVITLKVSEKTLYPKEEFQIEAKSNSKITYLSENEYYAKVSETGLVTANFVGETNILLTNSKESKTFKVIINPKINLYTEPDVKFGETRSSIIAKLGTPDSETETGIGYADYANAAPYLILLFDSSNKLKAYSLMVKFSYSSVIADFLLERYLAVTETGGVFVFINGLNLNTATMIIGLSFYNTSYWQVIYLPNTQSASIRSVKSFESVNEFDELFNQLQ